MANYTGATAIFQVMSTATAGNLGGAGFNPFNANFPTDGVIAGGTGNSATITPTSSYTPVSGDVGAWVFFPVQTGVTFPTWAQIASVTAGAATLNTAIGQCVQIQNNRFVTNTTAGIASTATPTLTYGIDYSQQNSGRYTATTASGTTTSFTDTTNTPGKNWIGNFLCLSTGTGLTVGWYECTNESGGTVTLDRSAGTSYSAVTYHLGGAVSLGGSTTGITDTLFFLQGGNSSTSGCRTFIQGNATYTLQNGSSSIITAVGNSTWPFIIEGYNSIRGDRPSISSGNQPIITNGAQSFISGDLTQTWCLTFTGTGNPMFAIGSSSNPAQAINCKFKNTNTANVDALQISTASSMAIACECISYGGSGIKAEQSSSFIIGNYCHDCKIAGINFNNMSQTVCIFNIIASCITENINGNGTGNLVMCNTIYGTESQYGVGINLPQASGLFMNNIMYGLVSGYGGSDTQYPGIMDYNCFFNNTNNISASTTGAYIGTHDLTTTNPSFTSVSQVTGTTATTSGTTLTDSGKNFTTAGVVAGRDYLNVTASTGGTVAIYGITAVGTTTLTTDNSLGSGTGVHYQITIGRNFLPTGAM